jgi:ABC-2 type transport system permease protein
MTATWLRKAWAFVVRDYRIESGYKTNFMMRVFESVILLVFFHFLGEMIAPQGSPALARYGGRYLPFAVIGVGFARYFDLTLRMFSESIRLAQVTGCLDAMLSSQTGCVSIVLMSSLYSLISGGLQLVIILLAGSIAFGVDFSRIDVTATLLIFFLSLMIFVSFGVLSAVLVVWLKRGDPLIWFLSGVGALLGGAYFPTDIMPVWMQKISFLIPITYSLDALRLTMLKGYSLFMVAKPAGILVVMTAILFPSSLFLFAAAIRKGRREGTLMEY